MKESHETPYLAIRGEQGWCKRGSRPCTHSLWMCFLYSWASEGSWKTGCTGPLMLQTLFLPINICPSATTYYTPIKLHSVGSSMHSKYHEAPTWKDWTLNHAMLFVMHQDNVLKLNLLTTCNIRHPIHSIFISWFAKTHLKIYGVLLQTQYPLRTNWNL